MSTVLPSIIVLMIKALVVFRAALFFPLFLLGGVAIFVSEGADAVTFGFSFFGCPKQSGLAHWPGRSPRLEHFRLQPGIG